MQASLELLPERSTPEGSCTYVVTWPQVAGRTDSLVTDVGWALSEWGDIATGAADLLRVVVAAYSIDRLVPRPPTTWSRDLKVVAHVAEPDAWGSGAAEIAVDLLSWLTGDDWELVVTQAADVASQTMVPVTASEVRLVSGGLDSFCGAALDLPSAAQRLHLGHVDAATAVQQAQKRVYRWLGDHVAGGSLPEARIELRPRNTKDSTTRSRSLLFMALAIAAASGVGADRVVVPENGFTSVNLPLQPSRGGALSTKSTHPWTFHQLARLLSALGLDITVENPHLARTKGELLALSATRAPDGFVAATAGTLSCSKLDGRVYAGGNQNMHCGLCVACLVRRGAFAGAGIDDPTEYLVNALTGASRDKLIDRRRDDLNAVAEALARPVDEDDVRASAAWPPGTDIDAVVDLVRRGYKELKVVPRP